MKICEQAEQSLDAYLVKADIALPLVNQIFNKYHPGNGKNSGQNIYYFSSKSHKNLEWVFLDTQSTLCYIFC